MLIRPLRIAALAACALAGAERCTGRPPPADSTAAEAPASSSLKDISELSATKPKVDPETLPGAPVYHAVCAACHEGQVPKAPHKMFLQMMPPENILAALTTGLMKSQGAALTAKQRREVAEYLGGAPLGAVQAKAPPRCTGAAARFDGKQAAVPVGWGLDNSRFIPRDIAGLDAAAVPNLKLKWALEFPGAIRARSQPTIAYGAVYVGSDTGTVYALDLATAACAGRTARRPRCAPASSPRPAWPRGRCRACSSAMSSRMPMRWMPARASSCGAPRSTAIRTPPSRARPPTIAARCTYRCHRSR